MSIPEQNIQPETEVKQDTSEKNLGIMRRKYERELEQERSSRQAAEERLQALEAQARGKPVDEDDEGDDQPYVDKRSLKRELSKWGKDIDQKIDQRAEQKARMMLERERQQAFLKSHPDFEQILSPDMLIKFAEKCPDNAEDIASLPDDFNRQKLLYNTIKSVGLHKKEEPKTSIQDVVDRNRRSPYYQPNGAGAAAPYSNAGDFSEAGKKAAYERQQSLIKNRRG